MFCQNPGPVREAFQLLCFMLNRTANESAKGCYVSKARRWFKVGSTLRTEWYKGKVWCPTTDNHTWVVEHDGAATITGNSWIRKNGALQLFHYLPNEPAWAAGGEKMRRLLQESFTKGDIIPEDLRPEWMSEAQAAQVTGDSEKGDVFLLASWLPFQELVKVLGSPYSPGEAMHNFLEQMRPEAKFFGEMALGVDIFRRRPVEPMNLAEMTSQVPKAIIGQSGTPLDNLLAMRPLRELARMPQWEGWGTKTRRAIVGGALQPISKARGESALAYQLRNRLRELRSKLNRAAQVGDKPEMDALKKQILTTMVRMHKKGLQGVPVKIRNTLQKAGV